MPKSFTEQLRQFEREAKAAMREVVAESVADAGDVAQKNVPVRSGRLKRSLQVQIGQEGTGAAAQGPIAHRAIKSQINVGDRVMLRWRKFYAPFVEKGTRHSRAKPFVQPAVDQWQAIVSAAVKRVKQARGFGRGRARR